MRLENLLKRNQTKNALKYLKELSFSRKSLSYSNEINIDEVNYQVLTNGYSIIWLENHLELPKCPDDLQYPDTKIFMNDGQNIKVNIDVDKLYELSKQYRKTKKETLFCCIKYNNERIYFNTKFLMDMYKLLGTTEVDTYVKDIISPILFKDKNSRSVGILLPVRMFEQSKENYKDITKYEE